MARVTTLQVLDVLPSHVDSSTDLDAHIEGASVLVDAAVAKAQDINPNNVPTTGQQKEMERWLAAHSYALTDDSVNIERERSGRSNAKYGGKYGSGLLSTKYGQMALSFDPSGSLAFVTASGSATEDFGGQGGRVVRAAYLGTSE